MEVDQQVIFHGGRQDFLAPLDGFLRLTVEEINLHASESQLRKILQRRFNAERLDVERMRPDEQADVL